MKKMTAIEFEELTGRKPEDDNLERVNCILAGEPGHMGCGINHNTGMPAYMGSFAKKYVRQ